MRQTELKNAALHGACVTELAMNRCCLLIALCSLFLFGCFGGSDPDIDRWVKHYNARQINANPAILNDTQVRLVNLDGLRIENTTIRNATFFQTTSNNAYCKNVIFENCRFVFAKFTNSRFENVTFKGGVITCKNDADNIAEQSSFTNSVFSKVHFDAVSLDNPLFHLANSSVSFANMQTMRGRLPVFRGNQLDLRFFNCYFLGMLLVDADGKTTVEAVNCTFDRTLIGLGPFAAVRLLGCKTYGPPPYNYPVQTAAPRKY